MMILAAVLLVIGLIALAGMVARVNQLGSQTSVESNQAILGELAPLSDAIDAGVTRLQASRTMTVTWAAGTSTITPVTGTFSTSDIGLAITGPGLPAGARIDTFAALTGAVTVTGTMTSAGTAQTVHVGTFALWASSTPTIQDGIVAMLEQIQHLSASHGFLMDYELTCIGVTDKTTGAGGNTAQGRVIVHLSDGTVWAEVQTPSTIVFPRTSCVSVYG